MSQCIYWQHCRRQYSGAGQLSADHKQVVKSFIPKPNQSVIFRISILGDFNNLPNRYLTSGLHKNLCNHLNMEPIPADLESTAGVKQSFSESTMQIVGVDFFATAFVEQDVNKR